MSRSALTHKIVLLLTVRLAANSWSLAAEKTAVRPNVLCILTDQQRIDELSVAGNPYVKMPALDALAARGVPFARSDCTFPL